MGKFTGIIKTNGDGSCLAGYRGEVNATIRVKFGDHYGTVTALGADMRHGVEPQFFQDRVVVFTEWQLEDQPSDETI